MSTILVGLDGSSTSQEAFHEAVREASWRQANVVALHVVASPVGAGVDFRSNGDLDVLHRAGRGFTDAAVGALESTYASGFPVAVSSIVRMGHFGGQIISVAQEVGAELVVLGSRGLGGFRGTVLGSVTTYVVHHLDCPLLIIPAVKSSEGPG